jgi:hypothetical protein
MSTTKHRFLSRWRQLEETAFWFAERAGRATNATERDRRTTAAMETVVAGMALSANRTAAREALARLRKPVADGGAADDIHIVSRTRRPYQRGNSHDDEL